MKVILLRDVPSIGRKYEVKNVSNGYARNFLFSRKLAEIATNQAIQALELKKKQQNKEKEIQEDLFVKNLEKLDGLKLEIKEKSNEKGHLFAAIKPENIAKILAEKLSIVIPKDMIELDRPIKEVGEYKVKIKDKEFLLIVNK